MDEVSVSDLPAHGAFANGEVCDSMENFISGA